MDSIADEMTMMHHQINGTRESAQDADGQNGNSSQRQLGDVSHVDGVDSSNDESSCSSEESSSCSYESDSSSYDSSDSESYESNDDTSDDCSNLSSGSDDSSESFCAENKGRVHNRVQLKDHNDSHRPNGVFRRRRLEHVNDAHERSSNNDRTSPSKSRGKQSHSRTSNNKQTKPRKSIIQKLSHHIYSSNKSTKLFYLSLVIWTSVQFTIVLVHTCLFDNVKSAMYYASYLRETRGLSGREKKAWLNKHRNDKNGYYYTRYNSPQTMEELRLEAKLALGTAAESNDDGYVPTSGKPNVRRNKNRKQTYSSSSSGGSTRTERLREGCSPLEWHDFHFPTCNEIHEIDLRLVVRKRRYGVDITNERDNNNVLPWGFVGNGLWRDVFTCDPHEEVSTNSPALAVLKMMKSEHPYDQRNFQRHRRDALVMELLSSSHHLVPIYGYCANTVMTAAISHTLEDVIYAREKENVKTWSPEGGFKTQPKIETWMGKDSNGELLATRETEMGRIQLALGVFRGLMDLHEGVGYKNNEGKRVEWLPIIHADLQAKQYLVDSTTGRVYLNDFNRCRFVTKKDIVNNTHAAATNATNSLESCPVYIPTSPGASRSPEEYNSDPLSEKLDVYSAGNILYGIITGERPWNDERGKHIKASIQRGDRPEVNETIRSAVGTADAELTRLLDRVYEGDPVKRASAKEIVHELEVLLNKQVHKN
jgi:hypothetical protein